MGPSDHAEERRDSHAEGAVQPGSGLQEERRESAHVLVEWKGHRDETEVREWVDTVAPQAVDDSELNGGRATFHGPQASAANMATEDMHVLLTPRAAVAAAPVALAGAPGPSQPQSQDIMFYEDVIHKATKIQSWWRMILSQRALLKRWAKERDDDIKVEYEWAAAQSNRIDIVEAQWNQVHVELDEFEQMGRNALWQEERMQWMGLVSYLSTVQERLMQQYPINVFTQHEAMLRDAISREQHRSFTSIIEMQETMARAWLEGFEWELREGEYRKLWQLWQHRLQQVPLFEMRARSTITRAQWQAFTLFTATHRRLTAGLRHIEEIQGLEAEELQHRAERMMEEQVGLQRCMQQSEILATETLHLQRQLFEEEEATARHKLWEGGVLFIPHLIETFEDEGRFQYSQQEEAERHPMREVYALHCLELQQRVHLQQQREALLERARHERAQGVERIEAHQSVIFGEVRGRVGCNFDESEAWTEIHVQSFYDVHCQHAQSLFSEQARFFNSILILHTTTLESVAVEEREAVARAMIYDDEAKIHQLTVGLVDVHLGHDIFRLPIRLEEAFAREELRVAYQAGWKEWEEEQDRLWAMKEEHRASIFIFEKEFLQREDILRNELLGEEIRTWRLLRMQGTKELEGAIRQYNQSLEARYQEEIALLQAEEGALRQRIQTKQLTLRRSINAEAMESHYQVLALDQEREMERLELLDLHRRQQSDLQLAEMEARQVVEMSEVPDFAFCHGVRKLVTLEDNLRRLITDEQQRKITTLGQQPVMYHMDCEETYARNHIASQWAKVLAVLQDEKEDDKAEAERVMLARLMRATHKEEMQELEDFEANFRQRLELQERQQFGDIRLLGLEGVEQLQRTLVELVEERGWRQKLEMDIFGRQQIEREAETAQRLKCFHMQQEAAERTKRVKLIQQEKENQDVRMQLFASEIVARDKLRKTEDGEYGALLWDELHMAERLGRAGLGYIERQLRAQLEETVILYTGHATGLLNLCCEEDGLWSLLLCEFGETVQRHACQVNELQARSDTSEWLVVWLQETHRRNRIKMASSSRTETLAARFLHEMHYLQQSELDLEQAAVLGRLEAAEAHAWQEVQGSMELSMFEVEEMTARRRIRKHQAQASAGHPLTFIMLREAALREPLAQELLDGLKNVLSAAAVTISDAQLWRELQELQVEAARQRRKITYAEDEERVQLSGEFGMEIGALEELGKQRQVVKKQQAMGRLHFHLIERDARHSLRHDETRGWEKLEAQFGRGLQAVIQQLDAKPATRGQKMGRRASGHEGGYRSSMVAKKRDEWGSTWQPLAEAARPLPELGALSTGSGSGRAAAADQEDLAVKRSAAGTPLKPNDDLAKTRSGLQPLQPWEQITPLNSLAGQSLRSMYSYYCKEYDVLTKPQILAALPKKVGDFSLQELHVGLHTPADAGKDMVVIPDVVPGTRGLLPIIEVVQACPSLHTLSLRGCGAQTLCVEWICTRLGSHGSLSAVDLRDNRISDQGAQALHRWAARHSRPVSVQVDEDAAPETLSPLGGPIGRGRLLPPVSPVGVFA
mmetsp:Transcript_4552/g.8141  ORF Transcript_4552/g.8141 Transcript_4552/m.8141 type:complete len:1551 (-) Transcript_4552:1255-5907(-)